MTRYLEHTSLVKISFDDRSKWVDENLPSIRASVKDPLAENAWWKEGDDPWQLLATCMEYIRAIDSPHPEEYYSNIPVHQVGKEKRNHEQDGSCNGLQHYAALGLDSKGGAQVNLLPSEKPGDVYSAVLRIVQQHIREDLNNKDPTIRSMAELLRGGEEVNRKVVKQTVMTSVYGVTFVGAREQIEGQLDVEMEIEMKCRQDEMTRRWILTMTCCMHCQCISQDSHQDRLV